VYDDNEKMLKHATTFYKKLFGEEPKENAHLDEGFWKESEKVTPEENLILEGEITEEEIKRAINSSYSEGGLDPMGSHLCSTRSSGRPLKRISWPWLRNLRRGRPTWLD
jgi:rubrerythrin